MSAKTDFQPDTSKVMSFREHLLELRKRIVRATIIVVIGAFITWEFRIELFDFLARPISDALANNGIYSLQTLTLTESIVVYLKVTFVAALVFLSPYLFWELWGFISPGLYKKEKRFILPLTGFSVAFFLLGAAFCYSIILPFLTDWLVGVTLESGHVNVMITLQNTYNFALMFLLMFGLVFELPLVMFFLALWGLVSAKGLLRFWRYFVVISFIVAGILTPPDPLSQSMMAIPINILYGFGVLTAYTVGRAKAAGRTDASRVAMRTMSLSMLAFLAMGAALFLYMGGLPDKPLYDWAPPDATFAAGMNPRILGGEKAILALVQGDPEAAAALDVVTAKKKLDDIRDGMVIGQADGRRVVLLRADGLGEAMGDGHGFAKVTDDIVALGPDDLVRATVARGRHSPDLDDEGDRLLTRLQGSGPLWVWLPPASPLRTAALGAENAKELTSVGASLALGERRQIVVDLPLGLGGIDAATEKTEERADRSSRTDRVLARIEAARVAALAQAATAGDQKLVGAIVDLAKELQAIAPPDAKARIEKLANALDHTPAPAGAASFPALQVLAPYLRGVSVRRDDTRLTITAEIDDAGLAALFAMLEGK